MPQPPDPFAIHLSLGSEAETRALADRMAGLLGTGDTILLDGPIGAGKTAFARALIGAMRSRAGLPPEDVPSPTFTLVQVYQAGPVEIWHADLYRLSHPDEVIELGLDEAFGTALCLIEWPDRLGDLAPQGALRLALAPGAADDSREAVLSFADPAWSARLTTALAEMAADA
ncbi:tRNA (adenosine(37)-N6)-threonylcarbamoyltransferase complex ATPase subunit type 1 TsaE [Rhodovulum strictum]|uniref:tRNA threonylcarbamoyladenosine biosynthesis protein TsaE n=1 Tax=Rhodovulum strictum TaxID=58314 RepID=A0A844B1A1_9RHOB|nr:tRNA (adenosine(37)-N6)-threonylcarbamoyltransferase complex ATPase subunit type 1 TsaE [Rhodovulum strictum]MRH19901.1 tRNA (adenosine(37)-N6)-threonylcarbamoyltransferase complex ATPase subunit type 1 TsaE [Rhodovulum strictum]